MPARGQAFLPHRLGRPLHGPRGPFLTTTSCSNRSVPSGSRRVAGSSAPPSGTHARCAVTRRRSAGQAPRGRAARRGHAGRTCPSSTRRGRPDLPSGMRRGRRPGPLGPARCGRYRPRRRECRHKPGVRQFSAEGVRVIAGGGHHRAHAAEVRHRLHRRGAVGEQDGAVTALDPLRQHGPDHLDRREQQQSGQLLQGGRVGISAAPRSVALERFPLDPSSPLRTHCRKQYTAFGVRVTVYAAPYLAPPGPRTGPAQLRGDTGTTRCRAQPRTSPKPPLASEPAGPDERARTASTRNRLRLMRRGRSVRAPMQVRDWCRDGRPR